METKGRQPALRVGDAKRPPPELGVLIGDCLYNFRSAIAHSGPRLPPKIVKASAFPIVDSGPKFRARDRKGMPTRDSGLYKIRATSPKAQKIIESVQPYHRRKNPQARRLLHLHDLSNIDKHRLLHVTYSSLAGSSVRLTADHPIRVLRQETFLGELKPGAVIARWDVLFPNHPVHMDVYADLMTDVTFDKRSPIRAVRGESVMKVLHDIGAFITRFVVPPLAAEMGLTSTVRPGRLLDARKGEVPESDVVHGTIPA